MHLRLHAFTLYVARKLTVIRIQSCIEGTQRTGQYCNVSVRF